MPPRDSTFQPFINYTINLLYFNHYIIKYIFHDTLIYDQMEEDVDVDDAYEEENLNTEVEEIIENATITNEQLKNKELRKLIIAKYKNVEVNEEEVNRNEVVNRRKQRDARITKLITTNYEKVEHIEEENRIKQRTLQKTCKQKQRQEQQQQQAKQKREDQQKRKREEAINKRRNNQLPFRSSLECRWNHECIYGCGYVHLDRSTKYMRSNCCMNGKLSPLQANEFYERYGLLQPLSPGMQDLMINNIEHIGPLSSTYSNILSVAAIGIENGNKATGVKNTHVGGFENRGHGAPDCVTMFGRSFHYLTLASDSIDKIGK